ncbi:MAG: isoleucine--tRNA ligase [Gaiellaceae bacterium]|jgi:isoleucyl-tRNA synthetase
MDSIFASLPAKPDHSALELEVLARWESERSFERLREKNQGGRRWSFIDGPITANKKMGVHHMWGRTLKDVFVRFRAMQGYDQRYQNGYDCQGLWIEVGVEQELGLNSKREIEEYGLEAFARHCRDKVIWSTGEITRQSKRLGQWLDWGADYYTFSDTNIEYIWRFLRTLHDRGWLYLGHRATEWCPRCGTSISAHELTTGDAYRDKIDPSLYVRFPLLERPGEALAVWTTTPWTLPANVAAAVDPLATYIMVQAGEEALWLAKPLLEQVPVSGEVVDEQPGEALLGWRYRGPFDELEPGGKVDHRVVVWDGVSMEEGTGIVHIAPGCGGEDFELGKREGLPVLAPIDEDGKILPEYGWLGGKGAHEAAGEIIADLDKRGMLIEAAEIHHRYPHCWRCETPLVFRITDDWFIAVEEIRQKLLDANQTVKWTPDYFGKRMDDWLYNMDDWNISRRRYYGLPLPFFPCGCGHLTVVGSKAELAELATEGIDGLEELHRPWIDAVSIRCPACGNEQVKRVSEVGDVWLDAGIVPFSTLGWQNPQAIEHGYATGASKGLSSADLPDNGYWEEWFPADWVCEMREQIRLWFYSLLFMAVALDGRAPYREVLSYEKLLDESGDEMHGSRGNAIDADEAFERMGADAMRWLYCAQPPTQNIRFGFGPAEEVKRKLLTLWNSASFLVTYANIEGFRPSFADLAAGPQGIDLKPLDRWLVVRTNALVNEATEALETSLTVGVIRSFESFVDDLSNWYIRRSRRRFYSLDEAAFRTLWFALVQGIRVISPVLPFLSDHLWKILVAETCPEAPDSVFLAGWPEAPAADRGLLEEVAELRRVVELARSARSAANLKLRQPVRRIVVQGAPRAEGHADEIADELRTRKVVFAQVEAVELKVKPELRSLGPKLGKELPVVRAALERGEFEQLEGGRFRVLGHVLEPDEVLVEKNARTGWSLAEDGGITVAVSTELDEELLREGRVLDLVHEVNGLRKKIGLALTDRIALTLPERERDLVPYAEQIKAETLALELDFDASLSEPKLEQVER